jgi:hypothetical protein
MNEFGPGPEETGGEDWVEPSNDSQVQDGSELAKDQERATELVAETADMAELRRQAIEAKGEEPFLEMGYFKEHFLGPYMLLAEEQLPDEATEDQKAQAALEIAALKGLFYHDVGLHNNVEGMIGVQKFVFDRLGRPDLLPLLVDRIANDRAERAAQIVAPEPIDPIIVEAFINEVDIESSEGGDELVECNYLTDDSNLLARLVRENILPKLRGDSAALIRGDSLNTDQLNVIADEMLRADFPVIAVYDTSTGSYRVRHSEGDEEIGSHYQPR